ncbi:transcription initiation factor TFIID subunit 11-like [Papaver somniferum]|uniref:transcription initiation factor TFIID subunit 11-like n=1 Tax=Papaver somniferum TaxID=3469 RepID=UPI000E701F02|nr:transcription initiation factor TFIID subunit 11-like [Papaver somniferum]
MSTSSNSNYDYSYSSSSSSSSNKDSKASVAKSKAKTTHNWGANPSIPLNDRRVIYAELMKRKAEDDEAENLQRRKDRIRRRIQAAEEIRQFLYGVPSDSDADASEEETTWVFTEHKINPDRYEREFRKTMKQIEAEAEEDSDSDDPYTHTDFINDPDADSDEEEDSDDKYDNSDDEKDNNHQQLGCECLQYNVVQTVVESSRKELGRV